MTPFDGFPARMQFTRIPNVFFSRLLPRIDDIAELKVTLFVLARLYTKKGHPRFVTLAELADDPALGESLGKAAPAVLGKALEAAAMRGTFLHLALDRDGQRYDIYLLNAAAERQAIADIQSGRTELPGLKARPITEGPAVEVPDIFSLYEENIGLLTPMVAEELKELEILYPPSWFKEAVKEAVSLNKRSLRYIIRILESWAREGKGRGTHKPDSEKGKDKYADQKFGHIVRR
ncbi:MAG: DnaD domain protein [Dehalococcoidales bacterium]